MRFLWASLLPLLLLLAEVESEGPRTWDGENYFDIDEDAGPRPHAIKTDSWKRQDASIYVGVSSFRDWRCPATLLNYFSRAKYPERVFIGLVQQNAEYGEDADVDCLEEYCRIRGTPIDKHGDLSICPFAEQVRVVRIDYQLAAGPCFGRHMQHYPLRDEEFCMQTDSHMDVVEDWDERVLNMWGRADNEYGILTTYVHRIVTLTSKPTISARQVPHLCQVSFTKREGNPRYVQAKMAMRLNKPKLTNAWAAGFSFAKCHAWKAVPYDPNLKFVFDGEESSMAARLWTRGYDMYTPDESLVGHDYDGVKKGPAAGSWRQNKQAMAGAHALAHQRLKTLLGMPGGSEELKQSGLGMYGLGTRRSWEQYQEFIGANFSVPEVTGNRCGTIEWVPFVEGEWPPTENNLSGPYWDKVTGRKRSSSSLSVDSDGNLLRPRGPSQQQQEEEEEGG